MSRPIAPQRETTGVTAIFECKQARAGSAPGQLPQRRQRANGSVSVSRRREVLEKHLRIHYPTLRTGDSLFPEYDSHDFAAIGHRGYGRVLREFAALAESAVRRDEIRMPGPLPLREPVFSGLA